LPYQSVYSLPFFQDFQNPEPDSKMFDAIVRFNRLMFNAQFLIHFL